MSTDPPQIGTNTPPSHPMPFTRLELVVMSLVDGQLQVLLARRESKPFAGRWALPGGVLRIDLDDDLEAGARRVGRERLNVELPFLRQIGAVGGKGRDVERSAFALSVVYRALVPLEGFAVKPGKRVRELKWCPADEAMADRTLAFDHAALIGQAVHATRGEVDAMALPWEFLPEQFTLGELQGLCEALLGHRLDKSSFRRKLADRDVVEPVEGEMRGGANRPAQVYRARQGPVRSGDDAAGRGPEGPVTSQESSSCGPRARP